MTWIRDSAPRLIFAMLLSFALWAYVSYNENPDRSTTFEGVPVHVRDISPGLVMVDQNGLPRPDQTMLSEVTLNVRTDHDTLSELQQNDLRAFVDLSGLIPGDHIVKVDVEPTVTDLSISDFSFIAPDPEFVSVRLEEWTSRSVPIEIDVQGNLPFSFERGEPTISRSGQTINQVEVEGPQNRVERVATTRATANIDQLRANYVSSLQLQAYDANNNVVEGITIVPDEVDVRIPIRSVVGLKRVPILGTIQGTPAPGYVVASIQSDPPLINITGSSGRLDDINHIETTAVNVTAATGIVTEEVGLIFPPGVSRNASEDEQVVVTVQIIPLLRPFQLQLPLPVEVVGAPAGWDVTLDPDVVRVSITGYASALANLDTEEMLATVDVTGLGAGTHTISPVIQLPPDISIAGDIPTLLVSLTPPPTPTPLPTSTPEPTSTPLPSRTPTPDNETTPRPDEDTTPAPADTVTVEPADESTDPFADATPAIPFDEDNRSETPSPLPTDAPDDPSSAPDATLPPEEGTVEEPTIEVPDVPETTLPGAKPFETIVPRSATAFVPTRTPQATQPTAFPGMNQVPIGANSSTMRLP